jgi:hypothetical protein
MVFYFARRDAEAQRGVNLIFLCLVSRKVAKKQRRKFNEPRFAKEFPQGRSEEHEERGE